MLQQQDIMEKGYKALAAVEEDEINGQHALIDANFPDYTDPRIQAYDKMSISERLEEIQDQLTHDEISVLKSLICQNSGGTMENTSFLEILRWWMLSGSDITNFFDYVIRWKLRCGQSGLATKIWQEAVRSEKLAYSFLTEVTSIQQESARALVTARDGSCYSARKIVCTIPLNVLADISFTPPLSSLKQEAISSGHIDFMIKIHAEVTGKRWRSWSATAWPGKGLAGMYGDGITPEGNSHLVSFGADAQIDPAKDPEKLLDAFEHLRPGLPIERLVYS